MKQATQNTIKPPPAMNPHCVPQWPRTSFPNGHPLAEKLTAAVDGATAIAQLLEADDEIRAHRDDSENPNTEHQPFTASTRYGLFKALDICLHEVSLVSDALREPNQ